MAETNVTDRRSFDLRSVRVWCLAAWEGFNRRLGKLPARRIAAGTELALVAVLAYLGAVWVWALVAPAGLGAGASHTPISLSAAASGPANYASLGQFDPFHRQELNAGAAKSNALPEEASETMLDLKLYGVRASRDASLGAAVIRCPQNKQRVYRVGEEVVSGVTLRGVYPDRILLSRDGRYESLYLEGVDREARARNTQRYAEFSRQTEQEAPGSAVTSSQPTGTLMLSRRESRDLIDQLRFIPRREGSGISGFYIRPRGENDALSGLSIESGDVLLGINGRPVRSLDQAANLMDELEDSASVTLQIERDGQRTELTLGLQ
ncbi:MAG: type II secretion system protein N [Alphaproteobacteria bacterium]|nr:type II secretion system protein N [Alphaproteobacteria bacterium]